MAALAACWNEAIPQRDEAWRTVYPHKATLVSYYDMDTDNLKSEAPVFMSSPHSAASNPIQPRADQDLVPEFNIIRTHRHDWIGDASSAADSTASTNAAASRCHVDAGGAGPMVDTLVVEHVDPTTVGGQLEGHLEPGTVEEEGRVGHFRLHKSWPTMVDVNATMLALQAVIFELVARPADIGLDAPDIVDIGVASDGARHPSAGHEGPATREGGGWVSMQSAFRVTRREDGAGGDPGSEGVHQDSAALTAIVMMDRVNVAPGTGGNRVWTLEQPCGKPTPEDLASPRLLAEGTLEVRFDTLFVLDRKVKHEALPFHPATTTITPSYAPALKSAHAGDTTDPKAAGACGVVASEVAAVAWRDVLTFEVRRPSRGSL